MRYVFLSLALLGFLAAPVLAQDNAEATAPEQQAPAVEAKPENPHVAIMTEKARKLAETLSDEEAEILGRIRENFGILRSIDVARGSVEEAVGLCAENNPELSDEITARHQEWHNEIGVVLERQEKNLEASISEERFDNPEQVRGYLGAIDDMAAYAETSVDKKIVTTPEACRNLMESMDETSDVILGLITDMDWPGDEAAGDATP